MNLLIWKNIPLLIQIPKISYSWFKELAIMVSEKEEVELCALAVCVCAFIALFGHEIIFIKELDCKI